MVWVQNGQILNSLTWNEEHDISSQILKTIFGLHASVFFILKFVWFPIHLGIIVYPNSSGQLAELIVYIICIVIRWYSRSISVIAKQQNCYFNLFAEFLPALLNLQSKDGLQSGIGSSPEEAWICISVPGWQLRLRRWMSITPQATHVVLWCDQCFQCLWHLGHYSDNRRHSPGIVDRSTPKSFKSHLSDWGWMTHDM